MNIQLLSSPPPVAETRRANVGRPAVTASRAKRVYDLVFASLGLAFLSPLFGVIAALIKLTDRGEVFYRQTRVGRGGRPFCICKFRTMVPNADRLGPLLTQDRDSRITWIGRLLRKSKLDELPQLWNVVKGEMSLVGPRPEVPRYVAQYTADQREILAYRPGITDLASLYFRNEEALLHNVRNLEQFYLEHCLVRKLDINRRYARSANLLSDTWIILQTVCPYWFGVLFLSAGTLTLAFGLAWVLTGGPAHALAAHHGLGRAGLLVVATQLAFLAWRNQCRGLLSYFSVPELLQVARALGGAAGVLVVTAWVESSSGLSPDLLLTDLLLSVCLLGGLRLLLRLWRERADTEDYDEERPSVRVGIIGAGETGTQLARRLNARRSGHRQVVAFFDDDPQKWHKCIHEIPVVGMPECLLNDWTEKLDEVFIAVPHKCRARLASLIRELEAAGLKVRTAGLGHVVTDPIVLIHRSADAAAYS